MPGALRTAFSGLPVAGHEAASVAEEQPGLAAESFGGASVMIGVFWKHEKGVKKNPRTVSSVRGPGRRCIALPRRPAPGLNKKAEKSDAVNENERQAPAGDHAGRDYERSERLDPHAGRTLPPAGARVKLPWLGLSFCGSSFES